MESIKEESKIVIFKNYRHIPANFTGVCKVTNSGCIFHFKNGKYHNESGPAIICKGGTKCWYIDGFEHREDGPSTEYASGGKDWFYKGKYYGYCNEFTNETWAVKVSELKYYDGNK